MQNEPHGYLNTAFVSDETPPSRRVRSSKSKRKKTLEKPPSYTSIFPPLNRIDVVRPVPVEHSLNANGLNFYTIEPRGVLIKEEKSSFWQRFA